MGASSITHRRVSSSSSTVKGSTPAEGGRGGPTSPGGRSVMNCTPPAGFAIPLPRPPALTPNIEPTPGSIVVVACPSTCAAALAKASNAGEPNADGKSPDELVVPLLGVGVAGMVAGGVHNATAIGLWTAFLAKSASNSRCWVWHLLRCSPSGSLSVRGWRRCSTITEGRFCRLTPPPR